jgi:hypothetical protein
MTWKLRDDLRREERCFVMTDVAGKTLGYFQEFADKSAGYWFEPMQQATPVRSVFDAKEKLVERYYDRFLPLKVFSVEPDGETHLSETFAGSMAYDEATMFANTVLGAAREHGKLTFGKPEFGVNVEREVARVRIVGNDSTIIDELSRES